MRLYLTCLLASAALSTSAFAQAPAPEPTTEQIEARAALIVANAGAGEFFVAESHAPAVALRHARSGMLCRFGYAGNGSITIVPSSSLGIPQGDDVACNQDTNLGSVTLYATRYPQNLSAEEVLQGAAAAVRMRFRNARELDPSALESLAPPNGAPPPASRTATFMIEDSGRILFTRISVFAANGWLYKLRFTADTPRANVLADLIWNNLLTDLPAHAAQQP